MYFFSIVALGASLAGALPQLQEDTIKLDHPIVKTILKTDAAGWFKIPAFGGAEVHKPANKDNFFTTIAAYTLPPLTIDVSTPTSTASTLATKIKRDTTCTTSSTISSVATPIWPTPLPLIIGSSTWTGLQEIWNSVGEPDPSSSSTADASTTLAAGKRQAPEIKGKTSSSTSPFIGAENPPSKRQNDDTRKTDSKPGILTGAENPPAKRQTDDTSKTDSKPGIFTGAENSSPTKRENSNFDANAIPISGGVSIIRSINAYRQRAGLPLFSWSTAQAIGAYNTACYDAVHGLAHHLEQPGAEVIAPGIDDGAVCDRLIKPYTPFELSLYSWLCEVPTDPAIGVDCADVLSKSFISETGATGHYDIISRAGYTKFGCAYAPKAGNPFTCGSTLWSGYWVCQFV